MKTTVCIFFPAISQGGMERALIEISRNLCNDGFKVMLFYVKSRCEVIGQLDPRVRKFKLRLPFENFFFDHRFLTGIALAVGWFRYLRRMNPNCVIGFQSSSVAILWNKLAGIPFVHRESSDCRMALSRQKGWLLPALVKVAKRATYRFCDAIVTNSAGSADSLTAMTRVPRARITVIYNPVDIGQVRSLSRMLIDSEKWFMDGIPVVMGMGRLSSEKNHIDLVRAFKLVTKRMEARLVIAGEGAERQALEREIDFLDLKGQVKLIGHVSNPYCYLRLASVFVLPSLFEGLPNCLLEATALEVPVVAFDCRSGPREILLDGNGGKLVQVGDVSGLAGAIIEILQDHRAASALVRVANGGLDRFSPKRSGCGYGTVVNSVVRRKYRANEVLA